MSGAPANYPRALLDHYQQPRHRGTLPDATHRAHVDNPLCGDGITMELRVAPESPGVDASSRGGGGPRDDQDGHIEAVRFDGVGCAISLGTADIVAAAAVGANAAEVGAWDEAWLHQRISMVPAPGRRRCASLPLEALHRALVGNHPPQEK